MSGEVPSGWSVKRVGEIAVVNMGQSPPSAVVNDEGNGLPFIQGNAEFGARYPTPRQFASDCPKVAQAGDILLSVRAPVGEVNVAPERICIGRGLAGLRPTDGDHDFLYYALAGLAPVFARLSQGSTFDAINVRDLRSISLLVPHRDEQRRIAEVLRSVDQVIAANRAALHQTVRARAATLHTAFEETDWEPVKLGGLGRWQSGGTPSKANPSLWDGNVPWVCPRDMKSPVVRRTESSVSSRAIGGACKIAPTGSLLIVVRGMILAKAIPTATIAMDATFNQDVKAFQPNGRVLPKFVQLCLQHQEQALLNSVNTATHGTKKLDADTIANVDVPLPDLATQRELTDAVTDMDLAMALYGEEHIRLMTLKNALMSDLLSGRVRVPA
ncbi:MAG: restriction endonuclease subunit S [Mesorhizobium sp.]|nr:MAG: restriction endonuclease subunit S [Mesorhizobium sp.]